VKIRLPREIFNQLNVKPIQPGHTSDSEAYFTGAVIKSFLIIALALRPFLIIPALTK